MYRSMGAGPGPTVTYLVDLPQPWGRDTQVTIPVDALVDDALVAAKPTMDAAIMRGAFAVAGVMVLAVGLGAWSLRR
jgi:hypothetical protein